MDWLLEWTRQRDEAAVQAVEDHLFRHTIDESRIRDAVEAAETALASAGRAGGEDILWLHLDWSRLFPT